MAWTDAGQPRLPTANRRGQALRLARSLLARATPSRSAPLNPLAIDRWTHVVMTYDGSSRAGWNQAVRRRRSPVRLRGRSKTALDKSIGYGSDMLAGRGRAFPRPRVHRRRRRRGRGLRPQAHPASRSEPAINNYRSIRSAAPKVADALGEAGLAELLADRAVRPEVAAARESLQAARQRARRASRRDHRDHGDA